VRSSSGASARYHGAATLCPCLPMIRAQVFRADRPPAAADAADWPALCADDANLLWVDAVAPDDAELSRVTEALAVDPRAVATTRRPDRRPTVRVYRGHSLVTGVAAEVHTPAGGEPVLDATPLDLFVGRNFLVSLHARPLPFLEELEERTATDPRVGRLDSSYLLYLLLDTLVDRYAREFGEVEDAVERLEEQLLRDPGREALNEAVRLKSHIYAFRRLVAPHRDAYTALVASDFPALARPVEGYFRDLLVQLGSLLDRMDHVRDLTTGSYNLYLSSISHRTNQQLRVLTFLSAVLLPMSVLSGIFGTNFALAEYGAWEPFYVMLAGMGVITVGLLVFFRRRRWL
jgi:magnesium transporter